jgi:hypothetical protein
VRTWPTPARLFVKLVVSVALVVGYPLLVGNIAWTAYDVVTFEGCAKGWVQITDDYKIAYEHTPASGDPKVVAAAYLENERSLESRAAALICPHSVQDDMADFLSANRKYSTLIGYIAINGLPADEANGQLLLFQLSRAGQAAQQAQDQVMRSIADEYKAQHPDAATSAQ